jgi:hypothetical protein
MGLPRRLPPLAVVLHGRSEVIQGGPERCGPR